VGFLRRQRNRREGRVSVVECVEKFKGHEETAEDKEVGEDVFGGGLHISGLQGQ